MSGRWLSAGKSSFPSSFHSNLPSDGLILRQHDPKEPPAQAQKLCTELQEQEGLERGSQTRAFKPKGLISRVVQAFRGTSAVFWRPKMLRVTSMALLTAQEQPFLRRRGPSKTRSGLELPEGWKEYHSPPGACLGRAIPSIVRSRTCQIRAKFAPNLQNLHVLRCRKGNGSLLRARFSSLRGLLWAYLGGHTLRLPQRATHGGGGPCESFSGLGAQVERAQNERKEMYSHRSHYSKLA